MTFGLAGLIAASTALLPKTALADTAEELQSAQQAVQESNLAYEEASSRVEELEGGVLPINYEPKPSPENSCMTDYRMLISYCLQ